MFQAKAGWQKHWPLATALLTAGTFFISQAGASGEENDAEVAGARAYYAAEFCGVSSDQIQRYKAQLKGVLSDDGNFDTLWERGQEREARRNIQFRALQKTHPTEYELRRKTNCNRISWLARNSLHKAK